MPTNSVALYLGSLAEVGQGRTLTRVEIAAIAWGVNILSGILNTVGTKAIGRMSSFNVWWTLGGTFVLVTTLLVKAPVKVTIYEQHFDSRFDVTNRTLRLLYSQTSRSESHLYTNIHAVFHGFHFSASRAGDHEVLWSC